MSDDRSPTDSRGGVTNDGEGEYEKGTLDGSPSDVSATGVAAHGVVMKVLVVDVGGTSVKMIATGRRTSRRFPSGPAMTPYQMVSGVQDMTRDWKYDVVSIGYPGPALHGAPTAEPPNLGPGWMDFDFAHAFTRPVKLVNDAAMQARESYNGGKMLFLGPGTGLGSAMIAYGIVLPLEMGHLPYRNKTFEDYVGVRGLQQSGLVPNGASTSEASCHARRLRGRPGIIGNERAHSNERNLHAIPTGLSDPAW